MMKSSRKSLLDPRSDAEFPFEQPRQFSVAGSGVISALLSQP